MNARLCFRLRTTTSNCRAGNSLIDGTIRSTIVNLTNVACIHRALRMAMHSHA